MVRVQNIPEAYFVHMNLECVLDPQESIRWWNAEFKPTKMKWLLVIMLPSAGTNFPMELKFSNL